MVIQYFSGLRDKDNQEIYEGDIIEFDLEVGETIRKEVVFTNGYFGWYRGESHSPAILFPYALTSKVIGNIFEHADLLVK